MFDHGFVYAVDLDGNWIWNVALQGDQDQVIDVQGCQFSSDASSLAILGRTHENPVVIELKTMDGSMINFIKLTGNSDITSTQKSFANRAVFIDKQDFFDGNQYIYTAYQLDGATSILRI